MTTAPSGIDTLLAFRLAYLRTIAAYWRDPDGFTRSLPPADAGGNYQHQRQIEDRCPSYAWPWAMDLRLVVDQAIHWGEGGGAGWAGPPNEVTIYLPDPPEAEIDYASALAAYYAEFPSFFGGGLGRDSSDAEIEVTLREPHAARVSRSSRAATHSDKARLVAAPVHQPSGLVGPLPLGLGSLQSFHEFGAVVARALALCWGEEIPEPRANGPIRASLLENGNAGLVQYLGFCLPWNMRIKFERGPGEYEPPLDAADGGPTPGRWRHLPKNRLTLHLPAPPPTAPKTFPVALAAYNNTGDAYPFTCGC